MESVLNSSHYIAITIAVVSGYFRVKMSTKYSVHLPGWHATNTYAACGSI